MNFDDTRKNLSQLGKDFKEVTENLHKHFAQELEDPDASNEYAMKMFAFIGKTKNQIPSLQDRKTMVETCFSELLIKFDEEPSTTPMDFFGYLNQFLASWRVRIASCFNISVRMTIVAQS